MIHSLKRLAERRPSPHAELADHAGPETSPQTQPTATNAMFEVSSVHHFRTLTRRSNELATPPFPRSGRLGPQTATKVLDPPISVIDRARSNMRKKIRGPFIFSRSPEDALGVAEWG